MSRTPRQLIDQQAKQVRRFISNPANQQLMGLGAAGLGVAAAGGGLGLSALKAYSDQANEYLPTGPLDIAGRMASNFLGGSPQAAVGIDPLADARNHVATAGDIVGTEEMLEALAVNEMQQMASERQALSSAVGGDLDEMRGVQAMIDARAAQLMQQPIQKSDGSVGPMPFDMAQRYATEQINMELRAGNVY